MENLIVRNIFSTIASRSNSVIRANHRSNKDKALASIRNTLIVTGLDGGTLSFTLKTTQFDILNAGTNISKVLDNILRKYVEDAERNDPMFNKFCGVINARMHSGLSDNYNLPLRKLVKIISNHSDGEEQQTKIMFTATSNFINPSIILLFKHETSAVILQFSE